MSRVKLGLVGAGRIGRTYAGVLTTSELAAVTSVADSVWEVADSVAHEIGARAYGSHLDLLDHGDVDAVIVCTTPATHTEVAAAALERGIHVMCEKPFALSTTEARSLMAAAAASGAILTMASKFRYVADVVTAKRLLNSGTIGDPVLIENTFASRVAMSDRWNSNPAISGGGVLIDNGTHSVDIVRYLLGPIKEVFAVEGRRAQGLEVEDTAQLFARCDRGVRASVDLSWTINKERDSYLDIYGTAGTMLVGWRGSRLLRNPAEGWSAFGSVYDKVQALGDQIHNFCRSITDGEPLLISSEDALASVEVIGAAYTSMYRDNWVSLEGDVNAVRKVS